MSTPAAEPFRDLFDTDEIRSQVMPPGTVLDGSAGTDAEVAKAHHAWGIVQALLFLCDHGDGQPFTLAEAVEKVRHPMGFVKGKDQLLEVVAYLACQVVGYAHSQNADAKLAMSYIRDAVHRYETALHARPNSTGLPEYSDLEGPA